MSRLQQLIEDTYNKEKFNMGIELDDTPITATLYGITATTFCDGTSWVEYLVGERFGYEITERDYKWNDPAALNEWDMEHLTNKPYISVCSEYLGDIIEKCRQSDNEMWYVEYEDVEEDEVEQLIEDLEKEVEKLGIGEYVTFHDDEALITVWGGVITKFLF